MTNAELDIYNHIYLNENPADVFIDEDSPYADYAQRVLETNTFCDNALTVENNKLNHWNMSADQYTGNMLMVYYASYFEMFAMDGLVRTFYDIFPVYCENVLLDNTGYIYKDVRGDTFLHYVSRSFDCREAICELYRIVRSVNSKVLHPLYMKNLDKLTPYDILLLK